MRSRRRPESFKELGDRAYDVVLALCRQLGVNRQCQALLRCTLGAGKIAWSVAQRRKAGLKVQRKRVIDLGADLALAQVGTKRISRGRRHSNDELIVHVK